MTVSPLKSRLAYEHPYLLIPSKKSPIPDEGWKIFFERQNFALETARQAQSPMLVGIIVNCGMFDVLLRECGAPEYDERSH